MLHNNWVRPFEYSALKKLLKLHWPKSVFFSRQIKGTGQSDYIAYRKTRYAKIDRGWWNDGTGEKSSTAAKSLKASFVQRVLASLEESLEEYLG